MLKAWFLGLMLLTPSLWAQSLKPEQTQMRVSTADFQPMSEDSVRLALEALLVDLTARRDWLDALDIRLELSTATAYVSSHSIDYSTQPPSVDYQFDPSVIERLIKTQGLFVWPKPRPTVLVWVMNSTERRFQSLASIDSVEFTRLQQDLGLNLTAPLLDLTEQQMAREALLWAGEVEPVLRQAQSYSADYIVLAEGAGNNWRLTLYRGYERIESSENWAALGEFIYQQAKLKASSRATIRLELTQVQSWSDYQAVVKQLESHPWWLATEVRQLSPNAVRLDLTVQGSRLDWIRQWLPESGWVWKNPDQPLVSPLIFAWEAQ